MSVRDGLLSLLSTDAGNGYQLKRRFETATNDVWSLNVGQIYTTIDRLLRDGMVEATTDPGAATSTTKIYRITPEGAREAEEWRMSSPDDIDLPRDDLMLKVLTAIPQGTSYALEVIDRHRAALFSMLQRYRKSPVQPADGQSAVAAACIGDAFILKAEADLRWLELCEARLRNQEMG